MKKRMVILLALLLAVALTGAVAFYRSNSDSASGENSTGTTLCEHPTSPAVASPPPADKSSSNGAFCEHPTGTRPRANAAPAQLQNTNPPENPKLQ
jgi:hypothetical protein